MKLSNLINAIALLTLFVMFRAGDAAAITTLKKVQVTDGSRIDLMFDGKVNPKQIQTEFFNDTIQLSITDVAVYPAKITSVSGMDLTKVFAYQYAPKLVRCRLTVKGKAEDFQKRFTVHPSGRMLSLRIAPSGPSESAAADQIALSAAKAERAADRAEKDEDVKVAGEQEKALLEKVLKGDRNDKRERAERAEKAERAAAESAKPLGGGRPLPSPLRSMAVLVVMLGALMAVAFAVRKARGAPLQNHKGFSGLMNRFGKLSGKPKLIEVVANHYLGPKKSISVVRIGGRTLVLGITNESINLITQLSGNGEEATRQLATDSGALDALGEQLAIESLGIKPEATALASGPTASGPANFGMPGTAADSFADLMATERSRPQPAAPVNNSRLSAPSGAPAGARAQIRSKLEGLKPL